MLVPGSLELELELEASTGEGASGRGGGAPKPSSTSPDVSMGRALELGADELLELELAGELAGVDVGRAARGTGARRGLWSRS